MDTRTPLDRTPLEYALMLTKTRFEDKRREDADGRLTGLMRTIPVRAVLATAWNPGRLERCRRQLAEGTTPPPIKVCEVFREDGAPAVYVVADGMHRVVAAREAGQHAIRAEVEGWYVSNPPRFTIYRGVLWDTEPQDPLSPGAWRHVASTDRMVPGTVEALLELGVQLG